MIGLVGGLGVGAAIHYYRELAAEHDKLQRPLELVMVHAQMARVFELASTNDMHGLAAYIAGLFVEMKAAGATVGVIPAVTGHICIDELKPISPLPIVDLVEALDYEIKRRAITRVALFGTRFVVESDMFGRLPAVTFARPRPEEIAFIHDTYSQLARTGAVSLEQRQQLVSIATTLQQRDGAEAIVLAGTDLALIFDEHNTPFPYLDCARAHIQAIMRSLNP